MNQLGNNKLREESAKVTYKSLADIMFVVHHHESGRVAESVIQLLSDKKFNVLSLLVVGNESDPYAANLAADFVTLLAKKMGVKGDSKEFFIPAINNFFKLVNFEKLRRENSLVYLWPTDFFTELELGTGPNSLTIELTEAGKELGYRELLNLFKEDDQPIQ